MIERILVPLEGSDVSERILPYATHVAKGLLARVVLVSVVDPETANLDQIVHELTARREGRAGPGFGGVGTEDMAISHEQTGVGVHHEGGEIHGTQIIDGMRVEAEEYLQRVSERLNQEGIETEAHVRIGRPDEEIGKVCAETGCGLIMMSTHGRTPVTRAVLGSVTDAVLRSASVPVFTIEAEVAADSSDGAVDIANAMVALDGSPLAESVMPYVAELSSKLGIGVHLARVVEPSPSAFTGRFLINPNRLIERMERDATAYLAGVESRYREQVLSIRSQVIVGHASSSLLKLAEEGEFDLIVTATHGRSGLARWALGSVADALIRGSGVPVMVVPPGAASQGDATSAPTTRDGH
jgi:nucleotide-binding universal stress UspA family protein